MRARSAWPVLAAAEGIAGGFVIDP